MIPIEGQTLWVAGGLLTAFAMGALMMWGFNVSREMHLGVNRRAASGTMSRRRSTPIARGR